MFKNLKEEEMKIFRTGYCPDCKIGKFLEGPSGGNSINVKCDNPKCGSTFNDGQPLSVQRIPDSGAYKPGRYLYKYNK